MKLRNWKNMPLCQYRKVIGDDLVHIVVVLTLFMLDDADIPQLDERLRKLEKKVESQSGIIQNQSRKLDSLLDIYHEMVIELLL